MALFTHAVGGHRYQFRDLHVLLAKATPLRSGDLLAAAGCSFVMGIPGAHDTMLNDQTTSFHDALYARRLLGLRPAPEFEAWLQRMQIFEGDGVAQLASALPEPFAHALRA